MTPDVRPRRVLPASERRAQIIDAVFHVVAEHGISSTTMAKVAEYAEVGVGTIYRYFADQKAVLRAAVEELSTQMSQPIYASFRDNAFDQIREMAQRRHAFVSSNGGSIARLWMEFVAANPALGLHDTVLSTQRHAFEAIREVCVRGVAQGSIRKDVDVDLLAFQILQQAWGADMSVVMGLNEFLERDCSTAVLGQLLDSIAPETFGCETGIPD